MQAGYAIGIIVATALLMHTFAILYVRLDLIKKTKNDDGDSVVQLYKKINLKKVMTWVVAISAGILGLLLLGMMLVNAK